METEQAITDNDDRPVIFISHRHDDQRLAHMLRHFIQTKTAGAVEVFQSSYEGSGPEIGKILTEELGHHLAESELVLLIYTMNDEHWSYCMWECGVAFNPGRNDTRIVVLQCGQAAPAPLSDRVRVHMDDRASIENFVRRLLTSPDFFPRRGRPITGLEAESKAVEEAGQQLFDEMRSLVSAHPDTSWPPWPSITIEIALETAQKIEDMLNQGQVEEAYSEILNHGVIADFDKWAPQLFNRPSFDKDFPLSKLAKKQRAASDAEPLWVTSLLKQISAGICSEFYRPDWALFRSPGYDDLRAPMMMAVHRQSSKRRMRFDISFLRFDVDPDTGSLRIAVPAAA